MRLADPDGTWADYPGYEAAKANASFDDCCMNEAWRGRQCQYHNGFEDGYTQALADLDAVTPPL